MSPLPSSGLPMFPLGAVVLPGELLPLRVFERRYTEMIPDVLATDGRFGVVLIERGSEVGGGDVRADVGTAVEIDQWTPSGAGRMSLTCRGLARIRVEAWLPDDPYPRAVVRDDPDEAVGDVVWDGIMERRAQLRLLCGQGGRRDPQLRWIAAHLLDDVCYADGDPVAESFRAASDLPLGTADRHAVLAAPDPARRIDAIESALDDLVAALRFRLNP
ncbi:LON peptidase substrate-binding domain-containing protein [Gordonia shandongensis]|uniref:LON peptidase substrate-binding domain-containing protein n=1 Tax=Gordonia shandongensis TaxID=376351 RepID=UPI000554815B|nr:LON peptidase substrate-binding domain-containing protein [Gordonia shandongensis]